MTLSGLGIAPGSNDEICTLVHFDAANQAAIDTQFEGATLVDATLFQDLKRALGSAQPDPSGLQDWPMTVLERLTTERTANRLFVDECLWSSPDWLLEGREPRSVAEKHDHQLLALPASYISPTSMVSLARMRLRESTQCSWLKLTLRRRSGEAYFGELSAALHDALLDDPAPTRQGVKELLQNMLSWIEQIPVPEIDVDRPRHSQRVRLSM